MPNLNKFFSSQKEYESYLGTVARHLEKGGVKRKKIAHTFKMSQNELGKLIKQGVCNRCGNKECTCN